MSRVRFAAAILLVLSIAVPGGAPAAEMPLKGIVLWPDQARRHPQHSEAIALEFLYETPAAVVADIAGDGTPTYDWTPLERRLDDIASRRHQTVLRFRYAYPKATIPEFPGVSGATGVPRPIKALPDYHETFSPNPGGDGPTWYPDWSHPALEAFTLRFWEDVAARYDADPRIAFLEVGFGHWGEYHTHGTPVRFGVNFPTKAFQARLMRLLDERLRETPWCVSIDAAQGKYSDLAKDPALRALGFGLFDDSFMHAGHDIGQKDDGYNETCWRAFGEDRWRRAPCGGEISYYERRDQREFLAPEGVHGVTWEQAAAKYHMTFVVGNDSLAGQYATPERLREAACACGYSLRLAGARVKDGALLVEIANDGVAPLYHNAHPEVDGVAGEGTLRGIAPGETRTFRIPLPNASADAASRIRLVSRKLLPGDTLPLAIAAAVP